MFCDENEAENEIDRERETERGRGREKGRVLAGGSVEMMYSSKNVVAD